MPRYRTLVAAPAVPRTPPTRLDACRRLFFTLALALLPAAGAWAAQIVVDTEADEGPASERCGLRNAIKAANTNTPVAGCASGEPGIDRIVFTPDVRTVDLISETGGSLEVTESLAIDGGEERVTIRRRPGETRNFGLFFVVIYQDPSDELRLTNLILRDGVAEEGMEGGAIWSMGPHLIVEKTDFINNSADNLGGAVSASNMTASDCLFDGNRITGENGGSGAAIYLFQPEGLRLRHCRIINSYAQGHEADGGVIASSGSVELIDSEVADNEMVARNARAGAVRTNEHLLLERSRLERNRLVGNGGRAGAASAQSATVIDSVIRDNLVSGEMTSGAGGLHAGELLMVRSQVVGNRAIGRGSMGGGLQVYEGTLIDSLIAGNSTDGLSNSPDWITGGQSPGGGMYSWGPVTLINSTVSGNSTTGSFAQGGGIAMYEGELRLLNSTLTGNSTAGYFSFGGGIGMADTERLVLESSMVYGNRGSDENDGRLQSDITHQVYWDWFQTHVEGSHNLVGAWHSLITFQAAPLTCDPLLQPLADNGGATMTHALAEGSCAVDAGSNPEALEFDQRGTGFPREHGNAADIGAHESSWTTYTIGGTVDGLAGSGLALQLNGGAALPIHADGAFTFPGFLATGSAYAISVSTQPSAPAQVCTVDNGSGTVGSANVVDVTVRCVTSPLPSYTIGGYLSGLSGSEVELLLNGGEALRLTADGAFRFATPLADGATYHVEISHQPVGMPAQYCEVSAGSGAVSNTDVDDIRVHCTQSDRIFADAFESR